MGRVDAMGIRSTGQNSGEIDSAADPDALATFILALTRGMEVLGNAGISGPS